MRAKLTVLRGSNEGKTILVAKPQYVVGRGEKCQLRLNHEAISRHHCAFLVTPDKVVLKDLGSRNGTLINGAKIEKRTELKTGDEIQFGPLAFSVELVDQEGNVVEAAAAPVANGKSGDSGVISDWLSDVIPESDATDSMSTTRMFKFDEAETEPKPEPNPDDESAADETQTIKDSDTKRIGSKKSKKKKAQPAKLPKDKKKSGIGNNTQEAAAETLRRLFTRGN